MGRKIEYVISKYRIDLVNEHLEKMVKDQIGAVPITLERITLSKRRGRRLALEIHFLNNEVPQMAFFALYDDYMNPTFAMFFDTDKRLERSSPPVKMIGKAQRIALRALKRRQ